MCKTFLTNYHFPEISYRKILIDRATGIKFFSTYNHMYFPNNCRFCNISDKSGYCNAIFFPYEGDDFLVVHISPFFLTHNYI